jgi:hypothetical protein
MKLSDKTIAVLQGFAQINAGLLLRNGRRQKTLDQIENGMFAIADFDEEFPIEFGIVSLPTFLGNLAVFDKPELSFEQEGDYGRLLISDEQWEMTYNGCAQNLIKSPPADAEIARKNPDFSFKIPSKSLDKLKKFAEVNKLHVVFEGDGENIWGQVVDPQAKSYDPSNRVKHRVGTHSGKPFSMAFESRYFKGLVNADYTVNVAIDQMVEFVTGDESVHYYIMPTVFKNK